MSDQNSDGVCNMYDSDLLITKDQVNISNFVIARGQ